MSLRQLFLLASFIFVAGFVGPVRGEPLPEGARCADIFAGASVDLLPDLDTSRIERGIMSVVDLYRKQKDTGLVDGFLLGEPHQFSLSPEQRRSLPDADDAVSSSLMAPLGQIFSLQHDPGAKTARVVKKEVEFNRLKADTERLLTRLPKEVDPDFKALLHSTLDVRTLPSGEVMVNFSTVHRTSLDERAGPLRQLMTNYYVGLVAWVYRWSGLEPNHVLTNARMLDEIAVYAKKGYGFHFHLIFDANIWRVQERVLQDFWLRHRQSDAVNFNQLVALLPFAGCVTTDPILDPSKPIEFKRYFRNPYEDPFDLVGTQKKEEMALRTRMLMRIVADLSPGAVIEAHAHEAGLAKLYKRFGMQEIGTTTNEKFPDVKVTVLRGTREALLARGAELLALISPPESNSSSR
jgi:hypothetical protein